ncbi:ABC transporter permease [Myxococcota bacterium]|nr:ABC transporter permease [Myxococcota bacterium]
MRLRAVFAKHARQQARDRLGTALTLSTAPAFVALYGALAPDAPVPGGPRPFDAFVPGLVVFAVIMLVFSSAMAIAREVEWGAILRLKLTPLTTTELLAGISLVQLLLGAASVALTLLTAIILGFDAQGRAAEVLVLSLIACLASVGLGMIVASLSTSTTRAFLVASVAMFLLMLFSGVVFPRPEADLFTIGARTIGLFDVLPTTHLSVGLEKVLRSGARLGDLGFELASLVALSIASFTAGAATFQRRHGLGGGGP